jgi:hypothetical protein
VSALGTLPLNMPVAGLCTAITFGTVTLTYVVGVTNTATVTHGLGTTPDIVFTTPLEGTPINISFVGSITAAHFSVQMQEGFSQNRNGDVVTVLWMAAKL